MIGTDRTVAPAERNASAYHMPSIPHVDWGERVLARLPLRGDETVHDAGCGAGRLAPWLLERPPKGRIIGFDRSANMLVEAEANLRPRFGDRVTFLRGDPQDLERQDPVDANFSTATFHWALEHDALVARLLAAPKPGGVLVAQCSGPNIAGIPARTRVLASTDARGAPMRDWGGSWEFADGAIAAARMRSAGFVEVSTSLEAAPTDLNDADSYRGFIRKVVRRPHLDRLADDAPCNAMLDALTSHATTVDPPYSLDDCRLNLVGRRPA